MSKQQQTGGEGFGHGAPYSGQPVAPGAYPPAPGMYPPPPGYGAGSLPYASPMPAMQRPTPPGDTDAGLRIGGAILLVAILLQLAVVFATAQPRSRGYRRSEPPISPVAAALIGSAIVLPAAIGLLAGQGWARWYTLVLVAISGTLLIALGYLGLTAKGDARLDSHFWGIIVVGALFPLAWLVLLSRPTTSARVALGTVLVIGVYIAMGVVVYLLRAAV